MPVAQPPDKTTTVTITSETEGTIQNHTHQYFALQRPPDETVLQHVSQRGTFASAVAFNPEAIVSFCGYVIGVGLARGIQTDDVRKMTGCFSIAGVGAYALLNTTYSACKEITGCASVCDRALKLTELGAVIATIGFFLNYS